MNTVILCNGETPNHDIALKALREADHIVCCDGAIDHLAQYGTLKADIHLVGDGDSYHGGLDEIQFHPDPDQETNDLTKAVKYCLLHGWKTLSILGATGLREDHTLGNISLLGQYAQMGVEATMITNYGTFTTLTHSTSLKSFARQQVSIFSLTHLPAHLQMFPIDSCQSPCTMIFNNPAQSSELHFLHRHRLIFPHIRVLRSHSSRVYIVVKL